MVRFGARDLGYFVNTPLMQFDLLSRTISLLGSGLEGIRFE